MPNHVTHKVNIKADEAILKDLFSKCFVEAEAADEDWYFDFDKIIPQPPEVLASLTDNAPGINPLWYSWRCDNWDTKWGAYDCVIEDPDYKTGQFEFKFETAWSVPMPIFKKLVQLWPSIEMRVDSFDEGWNFYNKLIFKDGQLNQFTDEHPNDEQYERVYGHRPERSEDEEDLEPVEL